MLPIIHLISLKQAQEVSAQNKPLMAKNGRNHLESEVSKGVLIRKIVIFSRMVLSPPNLTKNGRVKMVYNIYTSQIEKMEIKGFSMVGKLYLVRLHL